MGWLILAGYAVGWLAFGWLFSVVWLDTQVRSDASPYRSAAEEADYWRAFWIGSGFLAALVWPIALPLLLAWLLISDGFGARLFRTPIEREDAARRELELLRKQARELGLPMPNPDQDRLQ